MSDRFNNIGSIRSTVRFDTRPEEQDGPCRFRFVDAITGCLERVQNYIAACAENPGDPKVPPDYSINAHPRWGKSDYARALSLCALNGAEIDGQAFLPMASAVLFLVPMGNLVGQFIEEGKGFGTRQNKWKKMEGRYTLTCQNGKSAVEAAGRRELDSKSDGRYAADELGKAIKALDMRGTCHIIGGTVQLVKSRQDVITTWIRQRIAEDPLHRPVMVFWDEIQSIAENEWAKVYQALTKAGAFHVGMTGTINRDDGSLVSSMRRTPLEQKQYEHKVFLGSRPAEDGKVWIKTRTDTRERHIFSDKADITISPKEGYERGYLCEVSTFFYDVELKVLMRDHGKEVPGLLDGLTGEDLRSTKLSQLSESAAKSIIGRLVRVPHIAKSLLATGLAKLDGHIPFLPDGRMIVFCCADQPVGTDKEEAKKIEREADAHLKQIEKWIVELRPDLKGKVCRLTGNALDESGEKLSRAMTAFEQSDQRVVLVKAMGNAGWDFPSLCVAVDLSPTRAEVTKAQSIFRPQTVKYDTSGQKYLRCDLVMLADPMNQRIVAKYIQDQGGERESTTVLVEKGQEIERKVKRKDRRDEAEYLVSDGRSAVITDQDRRLIDYDRCAAIAEQLVSIPGSPWVGLTQTKAHQMLAALPGGFDAAERAIGAPVHEPDLGMNRDDLRSAINQNVNKAAGWVLPQLPSGVGIKFKKVVSIAYTCLRDAAGVLTDGVKLADLPREELDRLHLTSQTWSFRQSVLVQVQSLFNEEAA